MKKKIFFLVLIALTIVTRMGENSEKLPPLQHKLDDKNVVDCVILESSGAMDWTLSASGCAGH